MQNEYLDLFAKTTETSLDAARKLGELNMRTFEMLLQQQTAMINACMDMATKSLEAAGKAKGMQELIEGQTQIGRDFSERSMDMVRKGLTAVNETGAEYGNLVQDSIKTAQEQLAAAAKAGLKAA